MATNKTYPMNAGNRFDYYAPLAPIGSPRPSIVAKASVFTLLANGRVKDPYKTITKHYPKTNKAPFGTEGSLGSQKQVVSRQEATLAALECGYGKRGTWSSTLALDIEASRRLARYLLLRMETAAACIARNGNHELSPRGFAKKLEKSETAAVSFIIGSIGTFLSASRWLKAGGQTMSAFLHHDVFTHATASLSAAVSAPSVGTKRPDFLVASKDGKWHVFEAKGGRAGERWPRLAEGLQQLDVVTSVCWTHGTPQRPESRVCVHTAFDLDKPLTVTAVDPPSGGDVPGHTERISLIEEVCRLLVALETIDYFNVLLEHLPQRQAGSSEGWTYGSTPRFGGLTVAVPSSLLDMEDQFRRRLSLYLLMREEFENSTSHTQASVPVVAARAVQRYTENSNRFAGQDSRQWEPSAFAQLNEVGLEYDLFQGCADALGLRQLANQLPPVVEPPGMVRSASLSDGLLTTGGMFIAKGTVGQ